MIDGRQYLEDAAREFRRLKSLGDRAIEQIGDDAFFATLDAGSNSIAVLVKHLAGNLRSRWTDFLTSDGEKSWRNRDSEFVVDDTREAILAAWNDGWATLFGALDTVDPERLDATVTIRREEHTIAQAIGRQLTHYAYHVGQIVLLAKHSAGDGWTSLSVPRGGSDAFNRAPRKYTAPSGEGEDGGRA